MRTTSGQYRQSSKSSSKCRPPTGGESVIVVIVVFFLALLFLSFEPIREIILDLDSSVSETYGNQEGSAYNGYFGCECYHPLFCFNQFGDLERALLREGNVASADDWRSVLEPVVGRYRDGDIRRFFRGDAAFAKPEVYKYLEEEGYLYAIRWDVKASLPGPRKGL